MTPQQFILAWSNSNNPLCPLSSFRIEPFNLSKSTVDFLTIAGLPTYADPELRFSKDTDDLFYGINKLTDVFGFLDKTGDYEKYIVIGSCRDGDPIAINTTQNDQIEQLDHEDFFRPRFFNSSLAALAEFLVAFRDFTQSQLSNESISGYFQLFNFSNSQFDILKNKLLSIDTKAITENGFWKEELEIMLLQRQEHFGNPI